MMTSPVETAGSDRDFHARRETTVSLLARAADLARDELDTDALRLLRDAEQRLLDESFVVVVCGEFKRGKSMLVNALLDEPGLLPSDVDITTSVVATIGWGKAEEFTVVYAEDHGEARTERVARGDLPRYVTERQNPENDLGVREVQIRLPLPKLRGGLTLADTPGTGVRNARHTAAAYDFVRRATAALFVWDVGTRLTENELAFLDVVRKYAAKIVFVLTKIDQDPDFDQTLGDERQMLARRLELTPEEITIVPVSSTQKLRFLETGDRMDLELSGFAELEEAVWDKLATESGDLRILRELSELQRGLGVLCRPLEAERAARLSSSNTDVGQLAAETEAMTARLEDLTSETPAWLGELEEEMHAAWEQVDRRRRRLFQDVARDFHEALDTDAVLSPEQLVSRVTLGCTHAVGECTEQLAAAAIEVHAKVRSSSGLELVSHLGEVEWAPPEAGVSFGRLKTTRLRKAGLLVTAGRGGWAVTSAAASTSYGLIINGVIAATAGPFLAGGALAGGTIWAGYRGVRALRQTNRTDRQRARERLTTVVERLLSDAARDAEEALAHAHHELTSAMRNEFRSRLNQELSVRRRAFAELTKQRDRTGGAADRVQAIERVLRTARGLEEEANALMAALLGVPAATADAEPADA